jgi:hypothetical protein
VHDCGICVRKLSLIGGKYLKTKNNNKFKIITFILLVIYLIGLFIGNWFNIIFLSILGNICLELTFCVVLFKINKLRVSVIIYCVLFLIGQAIGYGLNINFLKIYLSIDNGHGSSYSLPSTVIPIVLTFVINFVYQKFNKKATNR